ncbi:uncharacterized protein LOC132755457 [Ruditapes philippinarum]|uniref:uncharacterized protein LOC132755457 n=1 Tax=Ruditapes philippinarum TaxID=129788 RepID=UPI00295ADA22|nr:uncharacterized protein LOC132755457 [Ruditapes philippinarum]
MKSAHSAISMDDGFGDFGFFEDSTEKSSIPSNEASGFSDFKPVNAKPQFGVESLYYNDVIDPFEEGFGSFNSDDSDCDTIDTKSCVTNHDCSCYGLYQCHGNKCTTLASSSDYGIEQPSIGQWHDEPLDFGTWGK